MDAAQHTAPLRAECQRLHSLVIRLRIESPPKGRAFALAAVERAIQKLGDRCDVLDADGIPTGWDDPADGFSEGDQLTGLIAEYNEVRTAGARYPVPLPPGCVLLPEANFDPFSVGRAYNGKVIGGTV